MTGFVNERPADHSHMTPNWSETGDQYVLKLFRDHVFHQVTPCMHWLCSVNCVYCVVPSDAFVSSRIVVQTVAYGAENAKYDCCTLFCCARCTK